MSEYSKIHNHYPMILDNVRNKIYYDAIKELDLKDKVVLDLGAGLGIFGLMASLLHAKKVYLVDPSPILDITAKVVRDNGLEHKVICIKDKIENVSLPEKVDIIISVFTGNLLLNEDLLPSLFYARDHYLNQNGTLLPDFGRIMAVPVHAEKYYDKYINVWNEKHYNIDYSVLKEYAVNTIYYDKKENRDATFLSEPTEMYSLDFKNADEIHCSNKKTFYLQEDSTLDGFLVWFEAKIGRYCLSTSPEERQMHWSQGFFPLKNPLNVNRNEQVSFEIKRIPYGDWNWNVEYTGEVQKLTTFLSEPITKENIVMARVL